MSRGRKRKTDLAPLEAWARLTLAEIEGTNDFEQRVKILMRVAKSAPQPLITPDPVAPSLDIRQ